MEYLIDLKIDDKCYNAIVHFVATFTTKDDGEAKLFIDELIAGFKRRGVIILLSSYYRIDNDLELRERSYEYYQFCKERATASIQVEQFVLDNPDQNKSLVENLTEKLFAGKNSTARIGKEYNIPVRVLDKKTRNPITGEFYYFTIEHLIPKG
ncbi:MAG: hypothetical protein A2W93_12065 [Bacteroidetes bacterium GWF2_43_63]|nr:MAG: hypothetical protein A2W94_11575 [Bacteroidetes bacterium GWE2_42_42]OFY56359.1 MAG: hypothetical protein A2W93_12065 [Bacteroidetes bacterium GWF2_43_63]HBG69678.1 hypothetical protein [Bacteroidales bacterium]HCB61945.1 hypothetical protein [Bacteroidales bacterium]HCY42276.1 hypothetical protein [Prolixibacteraceae bacterium]